MDAALGAVLALLLVSGALVAARLALGPTTVDRAVALDALVAVMMAGIGLHSAVQRTPYYLPALLVLSFLGFTGTVSIARFMALRGEAGGEDPDAAGDGDDGGGGGDAGGGSGEGAGAGGAGRPNGPPAQGSSR